MKPTTDGGTMEVAKSYGMIQPGESSTKAVRAVFVIDPKGVIRTIIYYPLSLGRNFDELVRVVQALKTADAVLDRDACRLAPRRRREPIFQGLAISLMAAAYMLDDAIMVAIGVATLSRRKLQEAGGRWLKLLSGLVIIVLGVLLLVRPEWMGFRMLLAGSVADGRRPRQRFSARATSCGRRPSGVAHLPRRRATRPE